MKTLGWAAAGLAAVALFFTLAAAAERMQPSDIKGLVSGEWIIAPDEMNPVPIGDGGFATGFAFAPGRAELAYCAVQEKGGGQASVLRIVRVEKLWPVEREYGADTVQTDIGIRRFPKMVEIALPFSERERELLRLEAEKPQGAVWGPFFEGPILWSPDGTRLALFVVKEEAAKSFESRDLWVVDYATGKHKALTRNAWVGEAAWSPDAGRLAFAAYQASSQPLPKDLKTTQPGLWLADVSTGALSRIYEGGIDLEWQANGRRLRFRRSGDSPQGLEYDIGTGKIESSPLPQSAEHPWEISADRRYVVSMNRISTGSQLEVRQGASGVIVFTLPAEEMGCWQPEGGLLAYFGRDGVLRMAAVEGPQRGRAVEISREAEVNAVPFQPPLQWSSRILAPPDLLQVQGQWPTPEDHPKVSWLALISHGELRVLRMAHRLPALDEKAALGLLSPEEEQTIVTANAKQIALAVIMYASDWDEQPPPPGVEFGEAIRPYLRDDSLLQRPGYRGEPVFRYLVSDSANWSRIKDPSMAPMGVIDYWEEGGVVAFADGHVKWYPREELEAVLREGAELSRALEENEDD
jgi:prepilin-type processing-associated H-X9-DG protein